MTGTLPRELQPAPDKAERAGNPEAPPAPVLVMQTRSALEVAIEMPAQVAEQIEKFFEEVSPPHNVFSALCPTVAEHAMGAYNDGVLRVWLRREDDTEPHQNNENFD